MGLFFSDLWKKWFGNRETRCLMLGLDAAGKTTILYKLKLGEHVTTIPTIGFKDKTVFVHSGATISTTQMVSYLLSIQTILDVLMKHVTNFISFSKKMSSEIPFFLFMPISKIFQMLLSHKSSETVSVLTQLQIVHGRSKVHVQQQVMDFTKDLIGSENKSTRNSSKFSPFKSISLN